MTVFITRIKAIAAATLLTLAPILLAGCYYYDHDDRGYYNRRYDGRYDRYDGRRYDDRWDRGRWDRDRDRWRGDRD